MKIEETSYMKSLETSCVDNVALGRKCFILNNTFSKRKLFHNKGYIDHDIGTQDSYGEININRASVIKDIDRWEIKNNIYKPNFGLSSKKDMLQQNIYDPRSKGQRKTEMNN